MTEKKLTLKEQYATHQEYATLLLQYNNLKKEAKAKWSKKQHFDELEKLVKTFEGSKATTKKAQGVAKLSKGGTIIYITQDVNNPKPVMDKFSDTQKKQYFA